MKYLKVVNKGTVHRKLLELIGFSTKRDELANLAIIGSKGSGAKLLIPAALRLGLKVFVCSSDDGGPYVLGYETKRTKIGQNEVQQIYFAYEETSIPAQFILESFGDWDKPIGADSVREFKIIREILVNARDADPEFHWDLTDSEEGNLNYDPNEMTVFVSLTDGVAEVVQRNPGRYFKFLGAKPDYGASGIGNIYPKSSPQTRVFVLGVLAECSKGDFFDAALFDYSIDDKNILSEERIIKNEYELRCKIAALLTSTKSVPFAKDLIKGILEGKAGFENSCLHFFPDGIAAEQLENFFKAWMEMEGFGEKAVIATGAGDDARLLNEDARYRGYLVKNINHTGLLRLLVAAGIKTVADVVTRRPPEEAIIKVEPTSKEKEMLDWALAILKHYLPAAKKYPVGVFVSNDPRANWHGLAGTGETRFKEMLVERGAFKKGLMYVLEILAHELRHCVSGANDYSTEFEKQADKDQSAIMMRANLEARIAAKNR
ncbi:hypothetical protein HYT45_02655 [Candidatus Uhrbacteria bacterium]|nr:hypothetical protein [Candidatus Uhrbacteria bacterium]